MIRLVPSKLIAAACLAALVCVPAMAEEAGMIKSSRGQVTIERDGQVLSGKPGTVVNASDRILTGADGSAGIALRDNTLLTVGPRSTLVLDRYVFDSTTHQGVLEASIRSGTLAVVSGKLAKSSPETVQFRTPNSILGVRGTEFVIETGVFN